MGTASHCSRRHLVDGFAGAWLLVAPWLLGHVPDARWNSLAAGALVLALSLVRGNPTHQFGGGWSSLWKGVPPDRESR